MSGASDAARQQAEAAAMGIELFDAVGARVTRHGFTRALPMCASTSGIAPRPATATRALRARSMTPEQRQSLVTPYGYGPWQVLRPTSRLIS